MVEHAVPSSGVENEIDELLRLMGYLERRWLDDGGGVNGIFDVY